MSHYFDETLHRHARGGSQTPRIRRSSTARSIGARSDFDRATDYDSDVESSELRRGSSVILGDPEQLRRRAEADAHMSNYVSEQLERVRSATEYENGHGEEYETQA